MRLIDADELTNEVIHDMAIAALHSNAKYFSIVDDIVVAFSETIDNAPTIDAVPVVRCKDCMYFKECIIDFMGDTIELHSCSYNNHGTNEDDYCSRGKRREP